MHGNNPEFKTTRTHLCNPMITGQSVYGTNQTSHQLMSSPVCKENQRAVTSITSTQTELNGFDRSHNRDSQLLSKEFTRLQRKYKT
jgi:hypothetical protein